MVSTDTKDQLASLEENSPPEGVEESATHVVPETLNSFPAPSCDCNVIFSDTAPGGTVWGGDTKTNFCTSARSSVGCGIESKIPTRNKKLKIGATHAGKLAREQRRRGHRLMGILWDKKCGGKLVRARNVTGKRASG
ncbi:MAG: hypothetical protein A2849_01030 [Candidatus Taylorbacteria bacterium RIFCSPHIGHO2_01_FULL_51_15]|uniref:Uncharacterized protein n=1 Tax=Candidatus Taylorbacteria bacterium RIFCSPHIGHO2_01_FULL_51_15 TaxID=1802304 RepID=A0A1G2MBC4_9BACT|nr:MAG: hypothetical protein A2849_01030 [Candidatus Taylorbacteria bacterium RIFCSPHIGHO2_01_FULL_51_15]